MIAVVIITVRITISVCDGEDIGGEDESDNGDDDEDVDNDEDNEDISQGHPMNKF